MRYLIQICYDGANFSGWQTQPNKRTVQSELEKALSIILKQEISLVGSGRTDAKVNALNQMAHFDIDRPLNNVVKIKENNLTQKEQKDKIYSKFLHSLNGILPADVKVLNVREAQIHARFSAKKKTYMYCLYKSNCDLPFKEKSLRIDDSIDVKLMMKASKVLLGKHDFKNFCASNSDVKDTTRVIYSIKFKKIKNDIFMFITGNGFLYKMVRNVVGILLEVGRKKISLKDFKTHIFDENYFVNKTAKPDALFLYEVKYN